MDDGRVDGWMGGWWMDGRLDGWVDGWSGHLYQVLLRKKKPREQIADHLFWQNILW